VRSVRWVRTRAAGAHAAATHDGSGLKYDEALLDWIFWRYRATVELTNRLIASRDPA
jgi:hypothetical protein